MIYRYKPEKLRMSPITKTTMEWYFEAAKMSRLGRIRKWLELCLSPLQSSAFLVHVGAQRAWELHRQDVRKEVSALLKDTTDERIRNLEQRVDRLTKERNRAWEVAEEARTEAAAFQTKMHQIEKKARRRQAFIDANLVTVTFREPEDLA